MPSRGPVARLRHLLGWNRGQSETPSDRSAALDADSRHLNDFARLLDASQQELGDALGQLDALSVDDIRRSIKALNAGLKRQLRFLENLKEDRPSSHKVFQQLEQIAQTNRPVLVGPWLDDAGLEVLYWAPFIRWFARHFLVPRERIHVISRGGAPWYDDVAGQYTDLMSLLDATGLRELASAADDSEAAARLVQQVQAPDAEDYVVLHPHLMRSLFAPYWNGDGSLRDVARMTVPQPPVAIALQPSGLPDRFTAVRFAFSEAFPDTPANRACLDTLLASLISRGDVVWLGAGLAGVDGPGQSLYEPTPSHRLHHIDHLLTPERSLSMQAAVMALADAYVGTLGGLSYVAPYVGIRSLAIYSERTFYPHYRRMPDLVHSSGVRQAPVVVNVQRAGLLQQVLGAGSDASLVGR
jgi:hypothetical protein